METSSNRTEHVPARDFANRVGLSLTRLYQLWADGKGPPRIKRKAVNWRGEPAVHIPLEAGTEWFRARQEEQSAAQRRSALKNQLRGVHAAERAARARMAAHEVVSKIAEGRHAAA